MQYVFILLGEATRMCEGTSEDRPLRLNSIGGQKDGGGGGGRWLGVVGETAGGGAEE